MQIELLNSLVELDVVRGSSRRSVTLRFHDEKKARLGVPLKMGERELQGFLVRNRRWLERAYRRFLARNAVFHKGQVLYNGEYKRILFFPSSEERVELVGGAVGVYTEDVLGVRDKLLEWLGRQTRIFLEEHRHIFDRYGVEDVRVSFSKRKWGWCDYRKRISFHPAMAALPIRLQEYLIYHEIAHIFEMNHSERFKRRLAEMLPDWRERDREMRRYNLP